MHFNVRRGVATFWRTGWRTEREGDLMAEKLLTVRQVQTAGEGDHSDGAGLMLRVRGVSSSWVLRYTAPAGRRREMGLGVARRGNSKEAGENLTVARDVAAKARLQLQAGVDPIEDRQRQRDAARTADAAIKANKKRQQLTLARAARDYHERVIEPRLSAKHAAQWITSLENHVPPNIWHKPVDQVEAPELLAALSTVRSLEEKDARVPETLRRIRQRLDAVFEDAIFHKHCATNPAAAIRRKMRETLPKEKPGQFRALDFREVPGFMVKLRQAPGTSARCLEYAILTAARTGEALAAEWREFNLEAGVWTIPAKKMKAHEEHVVHLSKPAQELLKAQIGQDHFYVFPSVMKPGQPMSNMALLTALDRLGVRSMTTVHGLCRASFSTWAYETAAARPDVIEACLAHKEADKVKAAYNRAEFSTERRALMQSWASYVANPHSNVVQLHVA
jgi:integrase